MQMNHKTVPLVIGYTVYMLLANNTVVYVGHSKSRTLSRIDQHIYGGTGTIAKIFDTIWVFSMRSHSEMLRYEKETIKKYRPKYNLNGVVHTPRGAYMKRASSRIRRPRKHDITNAEEL
jgi:excinuclease UvrABC nuclease subunit